MPSSEASGGASFGGGSNANARGGASPKGVGGVLPSVGGSPSHGGSPMLIGGMGGTTSVGTGGHPTVGGAAGAGGIGGTTVVGTGALPSVGGSIGTGGTVAIGTGGQPWAGGSAGAGGNWMGGSAGAAGGGATSIGVAGNAGVALMDFCAGPSNKVSTQGQTFSPAATSFESITPLSCCMTYGVALHSLTQLGYDLQLTVVEYGISARTAGDYPVNETSTAPFRVSIAKLGDSSGLFTNLMSGTLRLIGALPMTSPWSIGFCLQVNDSASGFADTRVYVPEVAMMGRADYQRFQIFRLADTSITPTQAASSDLAALVLPATPLLNLASMVSVERPSGIVKIATGYVTADILRTKLSDVPINGAPFVAKADGIPIYLGTFWRGISSMSPVGPTIVIDDITSSQLTIAPPWQSASDPRFDARIVKVLTETGKLLP